MHKPKYLYSMHGVTVGVWNTSRQALAQGDLTTDVTAVLKNAYCKIYVRQVS